MNQHQPFNQKIDNLASLLKLLVKVVDAETVMRNRDHMPYEDDVETEFFRHQIKQNLSRQHIKAADIKLATDFVKKFLSCE
jgi:hypothetical protein